MTFRRGRLLGLTIRAFLGLAIRAFLGLAIAAVLLGRSSPSPRQGARHGHRRGEHPRHLAVDSSYFPGSPSSPRTPATGTGAATTLAIPDGDRLTGLACSPWRDHAGRSHLVGCWRR